MHLQAAVGLGLWLLQTVWCRPQGANPLEQLSLGAMNMAGNIAEAIQSGAAINRNMNFDTPIMAIHSKTAVGYGDAMRPQGNDNDSSESEEGRRKRSLNHRYLHRVKRNPCFMKMATTEASNDDDVEARKRRAANNASRTRINQIKKKKKKFHRYRRQTGSDMNGSGNNPQMATGLGDRIKGMWLSFVDNMVNVMQQVSQKITSTAGQAANMANNAPSK